MEETGNEKKDAATILIVDDIDMNVEILNNIISHEGYATMCAMSVREALELMKKKTPALILSDLSMPEIDGLEFCRILKENPATRDIPFVFISVLNTSEEKKRAFEAGAVDFIPKPFDEVEVIMRVSNHLSSYRMKQQMSEHNRMMHRLIESQQEQIEREQKNMLLAISKIMQRRHPAESSHLEKVGYNCGLLAQGLQLLKRLRHGAGKKKQLYSKYTKQRVKRSMRREKRDKRGRGERNRKEEKKMILALFCLQ